MENKTAVEWLLDQLFELRNPTLNQIEIMKQAKEMEKQQIIDAYKFGLGDEYVIGSENYYRNKFNK
jgi:hypothetical protein